MFIWIWKHLKKIQEYSKESLKTYGCDKVKNLKYSKNLLCGVCENRFNCYQIWSSVVVLSFFLSHHHIFLQFIESFFLSFFLSFLPLYFPSIYWGFLSFSLYFFFILTLFLCFFVSFPSHFSLFLLNSFFLSLQYFFKQSKKFTFDKTMKRMGKWKYVGKLLKCFTKFRYLLKD